MRARNQLVMLLARTNVALSFGESAPFEEYIRNAPNPKFQSVSTQTTTRDLAKCFLIERLSLLRNLVLILLIVCA